VPKPRHAQGGRAEDAKSAGLAFRLATYGMAGDILPIPEPTHPSLEFARVDSEERLLSYADINCLAYDFPIEAGREGLAGSTLWKSGMHSYLGLEKGTPVSAAATIANHGCLFLALVATLPGKQRKGYGEAVVRKALYEGAKATGLTRTVLHATQAGAPVYERIGYRKVCTIQAFGLEGRAHDHS
jgi:GNAT superfamily N-acetyltransferase